MRYDFTDASSSLWKPVCCFFLVPPAVCERIYDLRSLSIWFLSAYFVCSPSGVFGEQCSAESVKCLRWCSALALLQKQSFGVFKGQLSCYRGGNTFSIPFFKSCQKEKRRKASLAKTWNKASDSQSAPSFTFTSSKCFWPEFPLISKGLRSEDTPWTLWDRAASDPRTDQRSTRSVTWVQPGAIAPVRALNKPVGGSSGENDGYGAISYY